MSFKWALEKGRWKAAAGRAESFEDKVYGRPFSVKGNSDMFFYRQVFHVPRQPLERGGRLAHCFLGFRTRNGWRHGFGGISKVIFVKIMHLKMIPFTYPMLVPFEYSRHEDVHCGQCSS